MRRGRGLAALFAAGVLLVAACDDGTADDAPGAVHSGPAAPSAPTGDECAVGHLALHEPGVLTVATGDPTVPPWGFGDDPTNRQGFESALVYALAEEMGFAADQVEWTRTGFDQALAPGDKPYDFSIQQYVTTPARDEVVDFSEGYYAVEQVIVAFEDSDVADATAVSDLKGAKLGAAVGTSGLDYIDGVIQPDEPPAVFDGNGVATAALAAGQVDGLVVDLPTAYEITSEDSPEAAIVGVLPIVGNEEQLGLLFEDGSPLVACVNRALGALKDAGTLAALEEEWLEQGGDIPTLSP